MPVSRQIGRETRGVEVDLTQNRKESRWGGRRGIGNQITSHTKKIENARV